MRWKRVLEGCEKIEFVRRESVMAGECMWKRSVNGGESVRGDGVVDGRLFERGVCKRGESVKENRVLEGEFESLRGES